MSVSPPSSGNKQFKMERKTARGDNKKYLSSIHNQERENRKFKVMKYTKEILNDKCTMNGMGKLFPRTKWTEHYNACKYQATGWHKM